MRLPSSQVKRFYDIWVPLLLFVNRKRQLVSSMLEADLHDPWDTRDAKKVRDALWADDALRDAFVAENPASLSATDLALVDSWRYRQAGSFYVFRHLKKHSLFIEDKDRSVYAVIGLTSPIAELLPFMPCLVNAVLLPFENQIIYDSLIMPYNITFGPGIRRGLQQSYKDAKERGAIITSLVPAQEKPRRGQEKAEARDISAKVLDAFRKHLFRSGLSPKVVERDVDYTAAFANEYLAGQPEPRSLRLFGSAEIGAYLAKLQHDSSSAGSQRRPILMSLTRFIRFLRDTERLDYGEAEAILEMLKERR